MKSYMECLDEARANYVGDALLTVVAQNAAVHEGILEVIPGGDSIIVEFNDGWGGCFSGPENYEMHNPWDELYEDHAHLTGSPDVPVDDWTIAEVRADAVVTLIKRATKYEPKSDEDEERQRRCLDLAAELAGLVQKGLNADG